MSGMDGGAFLTTAFLQLQEAPVDVCCLFHGEVGGFGLFSESGVPSKNYYALLAFHHLLDMPNRVEVSHPLPGPVTAGAGLSSNKQQAAILMSCSATGQTTVHLEIQNLPWKEESLYAFYLVDAVRNFQSIAQKGQITPGGVTVTLHGPSVILIRAWPAR